jgi:hypothetical protein
MDVMIFVLYITSPGRINSGGSPPGRALVNIMDIPPTPPSTITQDDTDSDGTGVWEGKGGTERDA